MKKLLTICLVTLLTVAFTVSAYAAIPSISGTRYIKTFGLSTANNTPVYTNARLNQQGTSSPFRAYNATIYATDEIYVYAVNNTYALISYPTSAGRKQGYVRTSSLTNNNYSQSPLTARNVITTYRRPGAASYGSISRNDSVWTVARQGNYTQVVYPTGNTYKMAWITNNDYNNYVLPPSPSQGVVTGGSAAYAATASARVANALNWCQNQVNKKIGSSGECVDFIKAYYEYLGAKAPSGHAYMYATNEKPANWARVPGGVPQPGDILVYQGGKFGHVAIYAGDKTVYQQNISGRFVEKNTNWPYNRTWRSPTEGGQKSYWGYIRPAF